MNKLIECHTELIGITQKDCDCYDPSGKDYNITESTSGLYIDQFVDLATVAYTECGDGDDVFDRIYNSMLEADNMVRMDIESLIRNRYDKIQGYSGYMGQDRFRGALSALGTYRGTRHKCRNRKGAYAVVKGAALLFSDATTFNLVFKTSKDNNAFATKSVTSVANQWEYIEFDSPVNIPLWDDSDMDYWWTVYHTKTTALDAKVYCVPCSGRQAPWEPFFNQQGFTSDSNDIDDIVSEGSNDYLHGVRLNVEIVCSSDYDVCHLIGEERASLAYAWAYSSAMILLTKLMNAGEVNRFTLYSPELVVQKIEALQSNYSEHVKYLADSINLSDCFSCNPKVKKGRILA